MNVASVLPGNKCEISYLLDMRINTYRSKTKTQTQQGLAKDLQIHQIVGIDGSCWTLKIHQIETICFRTHLHNEHLIGESCVDVVDDSQCLPNNQSD
jgi:hypothetical protein